jgi:hypothetical protein
MATITPGTGGTLKSTTAEGVLVEALILQKINENDATKNPSTTIDNISVSIDLDTQILSGSWTLPVTRTITTTGRVEFTASEYLTGVTFAAGTGGTFKSTSNPGVIQECAEYLQILEANTAKNTQGKNNVTGNYSTDGLTYTGSLNISITPTLDTTGKLSVVAVEYLLT